MSLLPYVISSRVRLARNLPSFPSPHLADKIERQAVVEAVQTAAAGLSGGRQLHTIHLDALPALDRQMLEEKFLISSQRSPDRLILVPSMQPPPFSMLVNEEDHLRLQAIRPGLQLQKAWRIVQDITIQLQEKLDFAYSTNYGYLTACASNRGTGIRASIMLFLPALSMAKRLTPLLQQVAAAGYTVRGMYGEGSQSRGFLLQISQHVSFQQDEIRAFRLLETVCHHLIRAEQGSRLRLLTGDRGAGRTYLRSVRRNLAKMQRIRLDAGMKMLAMLRLSLSLQLIRPFSRRRRIRRQLEALDQMWVRIQPAHVRKVGLSAPQVADRPGTAVWHGTDEQEEQIRAKVIQFALGRWE